MGDTTIRQAAGVAAVATQAPVARPAPADKPAPPAADRVELTRPRSTDKKPEPPAKTTLWQDVKDFFKLTAEWAWLLG